MRERALQLLRQAVGSPRARFHLGQWEAIEALVERRERLLVVQRTGWERASSTSLRLNCCGSKARGVRF